MTRQAGFSLVELLVSLVLLAMLSLLLVQGLGTGRRVWEQADRHVMAGETIEAAQNILRDRLERAFPATRYDASAPYVDFVGYTDRLQFLSTPDDARAPAALRRYSLGMTTGGDLLLTSASALRARPGEVREPSDEAWTDQVLLHGLQAFELGYFGSAPPDNSRRWRTRWEDQPVPPELVRIRLTFINATQWRWPDLIIRPIATVDSRCVFDQTSGRCKGR